MAVYLGLGNFFFLSIFFSSNLIEFELRICIAQNTDFEIDYIFLKALINDKDDLNFI